LRVRDKDRSYPERWIFIIGAEGTVFDIITEVDAAAHGSQDAARLEIMEVPHAGSGVGLFGVREDL